MGRRRALPRPGHLRALLRRGGRRHRYGDAPFARRDRGGLEGLRHQRADPRSAGARLARAEARWLRRAARGLAAAACVGRGARRVRAHRGGLGLRLGGDAHRCAQRQRGVRARRVEAVHHERGCCGPVHGVREDRSGCGTCGDLGVPRRVRCARLRGRAARGEDGHRRVDDRRAGVRWLPCSRGEPTRARGDRLQARNADPRPLAARRSRAGARDRTGRDRLRARVRPDARDDGQADRAAPADRSEARRHGDEDRGRARAPLPVRANGRRRRPRGRAHQGLGDGEAPVRRRRDGGHNRGGADPRRLRLRQGVPGRAVHARREDHADLRGHPGSPAARDRPRDAQGVARVPAGRASRDAVRA